MPINRIEPNVHLRSALDFVLQKKQTKYMVSELWQIVRYTRAHTGKQTLSFVSVVVTWLRVKYNTGEVN